jgi:hypothetical protein
MDQTLVKILLAALVVILVYRVLCRPKSSPEYYQDTFSVFDPYTLQKAPISGIKSRQIPQERTQIMQPPTSVDLLPKPTPQDTKDDWSAFAPRALSNAQLLDATKFVGVDTVMSTMKNANRQLRQDPAIPKKDIGPFMNSTIEADMFRRPIE